MSQAAASQRDRETADLWRESLKQEQRDAELHMAIGAVANAHPGMALHAYVLARMDGLNQKEAAAEAGITSRTARTYETLLEANPGLRRVVGLD